MNLENVIIIAILLFIVSGIVLYLIRAKKRGEKCVGCPYCKQCSGKHKACNNKERNDKTNVN